MLLFGPVFAVLVPWARTFPAEAAQPAGDDHHPAALPVVLVVLAAYLTCLVGVGLAQGRAWLLERRVEPGELYDRPLMELSTRVMFAFAWLQVMFVGVVIVALFEDLEYRAMVIGGTVVVCAFWLWAVLTGMLTVSNVTTGIRLLLAGDHRPLDGGLPRDDRERRLRVFSAAGWLVLLGVSARSAAILYTHGQHPEAPADTGPSQVLLLAAVAAAAVTIVAGRLADRRVLAMV
ncbi:hypothetical protein [Sphaerisporangium fuscum]|uniref:hypothetical protein n=1 Tax=Sphaerisporangium fuscum TaxID=2835868 RepID=UPI001BDC4018|nr:hypothetical protein [Sphaerisporangium fuscum]